MSRIPPLVWASSRHFQKLYREPTLLNFLKRATCYLNPAARHQFQNYPASGPPIETRASQSQKSRKAVFIPYPALSISRIPHPTSILGPHGHLYGQVSRCTESTAATVWKAAALRQRHRKPQSQNNGFLQRLSPLVAYRTGAIFWRL